MTDFYQRLSDMLLMQLLKEGDLNHKEIEKEFAEKLERNGWKRCEYRNFISYGKDRCYISLLGMGFDVQSGIVGTNYYYSELDLNPKHSDGTPEEDNIIYIGKSRCNLNPEFPTEEEEWKDADGPYTGEIIEEE